MRFFDPTNPLAFRLGVAGLVPFYVGALGCLTSKDAKSANGWKQFNTKYGATILSFVGAVHWGLAMQSSSPLRNRQFYFSVIPSLAAFGTLLLAQPLAIYSQTTMFALVPLYEYRYLQLAQINPLYMNLRWVLSGGAFIAQSLCCLIKS